MIEITDETPHVDVAIVAPILAQVVDSVRETGQPYVVTRSGVPVAVIMPPPPPSS